MSYGEPQASVEDRTGPLVSVGPNRPVTPCWQARWCRFPQRLPTPPPDIRAGQRPTDPTSTAARVRTYRRIPGGRRRRQRAANAFALVTGLWPPNLMTAKTEAFWIPPPGILRGPLTGVSAGQGPFSTLWQVKDSNLRSFRDGFTDQRRQACDQRQCLSPRQLPCVFPTDSR